MLKLLVIVMCLSLSLCGCSESNDLDVAPVRGTVTLDGKPLSSGTVYFTPEKGRGAKGKINADGSYILSTYGNQDGAIVGRNQVFILAVEEDGEGFESAEPLKSLVPQRYNSPKTSGIEFEVKAGGGNEAPLKLSKKVVGS